MAFGSELQRILARLQAKGVFNADDPLPELGYFLRIHFDVIPPFSVLMMRIGTFLV